MIAHTLFLFCTFLHTVVSEPPFNFNLWLPQPRSRARYVTSQGRSARIFQPFLQSFFGGKYENKPVSLPFDLGTLNQKETSHDTLLLYVHMPKTAGQTFHRVLETTFRGCELNDSKCYPVFTWTNKTTDSPVSRRLDLTYAFPSALGELLANESAITTFFDGHSAGLGHVDVSVGSRLPQRRMVYMTFLRDPVSRIDSMYDYMFGASKHVVECLEATIQGRVSYPKFPGPAVSEDSYLKKICSDPMIGRMATANISLAAHLKQARESHAWRMQQHLNGESYILGPTCLPPNITFPQFMAILKGIDYDNFMTRMLTGTTTRAFRSGLPSLSASQTLELAKTMLLLSPFVGLQDRFQDSVELYLWTFGFPSSFIDSEFVFNRSEKNLALTEEEARLALEMDFLDVQLYEFAKGLFQKRFLQMKADKLAKGIS